MSQIIFEERFNGSSFPSNWNFSAKTELAFWLGKENSNYVRFHPNFQNQSITSPNINVPSGNYTLYFDWNKAANSTIDSLQMQLSNDNGSNWETVYAIYNGNNRTWQTDSIPLNNQNGIIKIRWNYFSSGSFPSQYFNLDNVVLKNAITTNIKNKNSDLDVKIFPNPSAGVFQLKLVNQKSKTGTIKIYSVAGELVYQTSLPNSQQALIQIDISSVSKGAYSLNIETNEHNFTSTLLIQ